MRCGETTPVVWFGDITGLSSDTCRRVEALSTRGFHERKVRNKENP